MSTFEERLRASLSDDYEIERELSGAGMSRVFVATDRALGRRVVIKVLPPELTAGVNRERFRREVQVAAQLQHPHIVTLLSAGEDGDIVYYTMPFIDGESLRPSLEKGPLSVRDVVRILHDVVDALAYAHARGVIHRDIKPGNILKLGPTRARHRLRRCEGTQCRNAGFGNHDGRNGDRHAGVHGAGAARRRSGRRSPHRHLRSRPACVRAPHW